MAHRNSPRRQSQTSRKTKPPRRWWPAIAAGMIVAALAAGMYWFWPGDSVSVKGTPRLAVDRSEVDLGVLPYEAPARVTFVLTNAGNGPLTITETPRVRVVRGC